MNGTPELNQSLSITQAGGDYKAYPDSWLEFLIAEIGRNGEPESGSERHALREQYQAELDARASSSVSIPEQGLMHHPV